MRKMKDETMTDHPMTDSEDEVLERMVAVHTHVLNQLPLGKDETWDQRRTRAMRAALTAHIESKRASERRVGELEAALREAEELLALKERPAQVDPDYGREVEALGLRIGFGALMSSAQASWRQYHKDRGDPLGGEFVAGPCYASVIRTLGIVRAALTPSTTPEGDQP